MAIVLQPSRKGALESIGMVTDYALSTQHDDQHITAPSPSPSSSDQQESSSSSAQVPSPVCNYGKGRWVADSRRPFYSGFRYKGDRQTRYYLSVLQHSRKGASESIGMVTEYDALSTQHTAPSPSPSSSEEQFIESPSSSAEYQFTNASDPPSAQVPSSVLQHSRKGSLESIGMVGEYALSTQHQHIEPSPSSSSEELFIESSSSANNDQLTESPASAPGPAEDIFIESSSSREYQFTNASPPSAQGPSPVSSPDCNYAKGSWVADSRRPLYSGFGCRRCLNGALNVLDHYCKVKGLGFPGKPGNKQDSKVYAIILHSVKMKRKTSHIFGWKQIYILLIVLILMTILIKRSRKVPLESTTSSSEDLFVDSSLSVQNQPGVPSPSPSSEEQFIESSSSSAEDQVTESSAAPSGEEQFIESSSSAEDKLTDPSSSTQVSVSMNQEVPFEEKNSQSIMTEEAENKEPYLNTTPMDSTMSDQSGKDNINMENTYSSNSSKTQVCNYSKGRWVPSSGPRFYSGFDCKRWLPGSWACRLTKREDFSYEGYRWQPMDCEMPEFERSAFLRK
ncbi:hypothetical protein CCACVL1_25908 [Corchorus capsularis]|uniref:Trichome birefringence-like N-terminal domain-containing protein n=1 Tax=Corchorus capsularis TaxID=210143 RepID=A0A1R3GGK5_COCAP|nr:hypothetical protein CCACVL1_25908 [Corchorus capsularis]